MAVCWFCQFLRGPGSGLWRGWWAVARASLGPGGAMLSLQSCPTLCNHIDGSPPGSPIPGILQARVLEWVAIAFSNA